MVSAVPFTNEKNENLVLIDSVSGNLLDELKPFLFVTISEATVTDFDGTEVALEL